MYLIEKLRTPRGTSPALGAPPDENEEGEEEGEGEDDINDRNHDEDDDDNVALGGVDDAAAVEVEVDVEKGDATEVRDTELNLFGSTSAKDRRKASFRKT